MSGRLAQGAEATCLLFNRVAVGGMSSADVLCPLQVPELNVQNGVLKALSFLFEYIGEMGKDYIYSVSPLLEDALMDRDLVRATLAVYASRRSVLHRD